MGSILETYKLSFIKKIHSTVNDVYVYRAYSNEYPVLSLLLSVIDYKDTIDVIILEAEKAIGGQPFEYFTIENVDIILNSNTVELRDSTYTSSIDEIPLEDFKQILQEWKVFLHS